MGDKMSIRVTDGVAKWFEGPEWDDVARSAMDETVNKLEETARTNAIWEDRTGDARATLHAGTQYRGGEIELYLEHGVDYGYWLEVIQDGRFAIILPTLEQEAPGIIKGVTRKVARARRGRN